MESWFVCSDAHDDVEALDAFAKYAVNAPGEEERRILFSGDFSLRPFTREALQEFLMSKSQAKFVEEKRKHNGAVLQDMKRVLDASGLPYDVIPENYDLELVGVFGERAHNRSTLRFDDAKVAAYGGADAYPPQIQLLVQMGEIASYSHAELDTLLARERPDVVWLHNPPQHFCDDMYNGQHVGSPAATRYIVEHNSRLVLCGHIHEAGPNGNNPNGMKGLADFTNEGKRTVVINSGNLGRFELVALPSLETQMQFPFGTFVRVDVEVDGTPRRLVQYSLEAPDRNVGTIRKLAEHSF